jgi:mannose-6-phosphate isomerase
MLKPMHPLRFHPWFRATAWGGHALNRFLGKNPPAGVAIGESWEISDHRQHASVAATVNQFGHTLRYLMEQHRDELLGPAARSFDRFPWLIKLLDVTDRLSVQVHPDANAVRTLLPGEGSKSEAWLVLAAEPGSAVYSGLQPGVGTSDLRKALTDGTVVECLHQFAPTPGDLLYLPAGTVHAVGGGVLLAEIQETSDATFRLYDWDRRDATGKGRELHIEQALASIHWDAPKCQPMRAPTLIAGGGDTQTALARTPHFAIDALCRQSPFPVGGAGVLQAFIVTQGHGRLANGEFVMAGDAWILPASMPSMVLQPEGGLAGLWCSLPDGV